MADTIYIKRGQDLNITVAFQDDDGDAIVLDGTWTVTSSMKMKGSCELTTLSPTISSGNVTINYVTDDMTPSVYEIDVVANDGSDREITDVFYLNLGNTITPIT